MSKQQEILNLKTFVEQHIIGQPTLVDRLLIALLADGHLLVEGAPGLAKTKSIKTLSDGIEGDFHRIQFTPDLLPSDLTGTEIYRPQDGSFVFQQGPLFHNLVLADEINRAPAKVQSALLEAMAERQITVGAQTYTLPKLFLVMATQNPIEQEGTYPLPEAQLDRFLMQVNIAYPDAAAEKTILQLARGEALQDTPIPMEQIISQETLFAARKDVLAVHMAENVEDYLLEIVLATRHADKYREDFGNWIEFGASPRASIALDRCARAHAWLAGRDFVAPEDIQIMALDVLRHRIILSYEAEAEGVTPDHCIMELLKTIPVP